MPRESLDAPEDLPKETLCQVAFGAPGRRERGLVLSESLVVPLLRVGVRLDPVEGRGERDARLPALARGQHPKRRILGQPLRVVGILVTCQAAIDRLAKEIQQEELAVAFGAEIGEVSLDTARSRSAPPNERGRRPRENAMTGHLVRVSGLFVLTALAEIVGCYLTYLWLRQSRPAWLLLPAAASLAAFAALLSLHPGPAGRTYAAYGAVYVATAVVWLAVVEGQRPDAWDLAGVLVALAGMAIIVLGHARPA